MSRQRRSCACWTRSKADLNRDVDETVANNKRKRHLVEDGHRLQGLGEVAARRGRHGKTLGYLDQAALFQRHGTGLYLRRAPGDEGEPVGVTAQL